MKLGYPSYFLVLFGLIGFSCSDPSIEGEGSIITFTKPISYYQTLKLDGSYSIKLEQRKFPILEARTHANLKSNLDISLKNGVLSVKDKKTVTKRKLHHITLGFNDLTIIELNGKIKLVGDWAKKIPKLKIQLQDYTIAKIRLNTTKLDVEMSDFSKFQIIGINQKLNLNISDRAIFDGFRLNNKYATIGVYDYSKAFLHTYERLKGEVKNYGILKYLSYVRHKKLDLAETASVEIIGK